jgi:predicted Ser/Thr protein kinase
MPAGALAGLCPACLLAQGAQTEPVSAGRGGRFEPPPVAAIAQLFPQLEILGLLGAGGMGAVYKARQPALDRIIALKVLPATSPSGANSEERFNREARALARLNHPNIVAVHEFGRAGELHFFVMEFVDGANLRQLEEAGRLAPREALQIIPQICDALQYAHDEGVVHRDIKPENVLVDRRGRVKIADFGLAKMLGPDPGAARLTAEGQVMGTPHYMAPEQVERPLAVDHRADIYSLGVVLYEMLTGDLPLGNFSPPSRKVQVDVRFDEVVLRALENDPARRYQHASEVKSRVETIAGTPAPQAAPVTNEPPPTFIRWAGFPVAVERNGVRQTHRLGVLHAFGILFGVLTIAFGLVSLATGRTLFGWLGISGGHSLKLRLLIAACLTAWGLRRTLRSKPSLAARPKTPPHTAVLTAERFSRKAILGACWIPFVFSILLMFVPVRVVTGTSQAGPSWWQILLGVLTLPLGFTAPLGTTLLGWLAVTDIRRSRGRIGGLPLAVMDGLFFPLLTLDALILSAWYEDFRGLGAMGSWNLDHLGPITTLFGLAGLVACAVVDFLIVRWVWRAVQWDRYPPSAGGDWWWSRKKSAVIIGLSCVGIIQGAILRHELPGIFKKAAQQVAAKDAKSGALVARLPNGGTLELLAISEAGALSNEWWRPDGSPHAPTTFEIKTPGRMSVPDTVAKNLVFRFVNLPEGATFPIFECLPRSGYSTGDTVRRDGQVLENTWPVQMAWSGSARAVTMRLGVSLESWHTVATSDLKNHNVTSTRLAGDPNWTVNFHHASERNGQAQLTVVRDLDDGFWQTRIVAVDHGGVEHAELRGTGTPVEKTATWTYTFPLPLKQVKEFRAQIRPLHWVEFRDVALRSKGKSKRGQLPPRAVVQVATRNRQTGAWTGKVGRSTVELLAVSDGYSAPNAWWTPDGVAVPDTIYEMMRSGDSFSSGQTNKDFIFRWNDLPDGASGPFVEFDEHGGGSGGGEVICDGKFLRNGWPLTSAFPPSATLTTARLGFAVGLWQTISTHASDQSSSTYTVLPDVPKFEAKLHQVGENSGNAEVTMVIGRQSRDWDLRVIAVDTNGAQHTTFNASGTPAEPAMIWTYSYHKLPLAQVKQFEVQVRPVQWIEFRDVALQPRDRRAVSRSARSFVPTAFGPPHEVEVADLFDFDRGQAGEFPTQPDGTKVFRGIERNPSWMVQTGYDIEAGTNHLRVLQMNIIDMKNEEWDTISPAEFERRLRSQIYLPPRLPTAPKPTLPVTHGFRTRNNSTGILQITALAGDRPGVTLRYKLIERAHFE